MIGGNQPQQFQVSVLLHGQDYVDTLLAQDIEQIEVITWDDERWQGRLEATPAGWVHVRVSVLCGGSQASGGCVRHRMGGLQRIARCT